jgi:hypothetical protein
VRCCVIAAGNHKGTLGVCNAAWHSLFALGSWHTLSYARAAFVRTAARQFGWSSILTRFLPWNLLPLGCSSGRSRFTRSRTSFLPLGGKMPSVSAPLLQRGPRCRKSISLALQFQPFPFQSGRKFCAIQLGLNLLLCCSCLHSFQALYSSISKLCFTGHCLPPLCVPPVPTSLF